MTIVVGIRIVLMSVPGSTIITSNPTPRSPRPSSIPFKPGTMPFAILIGACELNRLVLCFGAAWALSKVTAPHEPNR
jgi:hypothetical protein